jgi:hypothetical protein
MKKAFYVLLAVLTIIGMVSCGGDSGGGGGGGIPAQKDGTVRFLYADGKTYEDIDIEEVGTTTWGQILAAKQKPATDTKTGDWEFAGWKDEDDVKWSAATSTIDVPKLTVRSYFYSTALTNDGTALEKLSLENAGLAIYKFALGTNEFQDYAKFVVTYKITEADIALSQSRNRVYGEFSEWAKTADTTGATAFDATDIDGYQTDANGKKLLNAPKFNAGTYILGTADAGRDKPFSDNGAFISHITSGLTDDGKIQADVWFTLEYPINANTLTLTGDLYYGLGLTSNGDPRDATTFLVKSGERQHAPIVQLIKDVKLIHKSDVAKDITATIPTTEAQFMAYAAPNSVVWCYRGLPGSPVVYPDTGEPPPPVTDPQATTDFVVSTLPALALFQSDEGKTDPLTVDPTDSKSRKRITVTGQTVVFDIRANDYNNNGDFGGGGFQINFAGITFPYVTGSTTQRYTYASYKNIILTVTLAENTTGDAAGWAGKQIIFSSTAAGSTAAVDVSKVTVNGTLSGSKYIDMPETITNTLFKIATTGDNGLTTGAASFAVRANNWEGGNVPFQGTWTVTGITFSVTP